LKAESSTDLQFAKLISLFNRLQLEKA